MYLLPIAAYALSNLEAVLSAPHPGGNRTAYRIAVYARVPTIHVSVKGDVELAYFNNRKPVSEHVYEDQVIWKCSECDCWSRKEFVLTENPTCPICQAEMHEETKNIRIE